MKKISFLFLSVVVLAGCKQATQPVTENQTQEQAVGEFSKVAGAIQAGRPVACTLTKKDGTGSMEYVLKGKKMKITGLAVQANEANGAMISDGTYMYTWDPTKKTGMKIKLPDEQEVQDIAKTNGQNIPSLSTEEDKKRYEDEGYIVNCSEKSVGDDVFVPPMDITFTDTSAMMENINKMMQKNPSGTVPSEAEQKSLEEQTKELMKQYGQADDQ